MKYKNFDFSTLMFIIWICLFYYAFVSQSAIANEAIPISNKVIHINSTSKALHWSFPDRVRGINVTYKSLTPNIIETLSKWNVNVIRINIGTKIKTIKNSNATSPLIDYDDALQKVDTILPLCKKHKIGVILSLADVPDRESAVFWKKNTNEVYVDYIASVWQALSKKYKNKAMIIGYDILNEPTYWRGDNSSWFEKIVPQSINAIRLIDSDITLVIEAGPGMQSIGFKYMNIIQDKNLIYSFHHYAPLTYTHQGIKKNLSTKGKLTYPGQLKMFNRSLPAHWNKQELKDSMEEAIKFQKKHGVRILVGEFGVLRWAPGREKWIKDSIEIFEQYGWDWCFHSYGGWNGWNPTFGSEDKGSNLQDGGKTTKSLKILLKYYKLNKGKE